MGTQDGQHDFPQEETEVRGGFSEQVADSNETHDGAIWANSLARRRECDRKLDVLT